MRIACPNCQTAYNVDERRIPATGLNVRCPKCQNAFPVKPEAPAGGASEPVALPTPAPFPRAPEPAEGLGGGTLSMGSPFGEPPQVEEPPANPFGRPPPGAAPPGGTMSFPAPFGAEPPGPGSHGTLSFEDPFGSEPRAATPPFGSVPLPRPGSAGAYPDAAFEAHPEVTAPGMPLPTAPMPEVPLGFGEVDLNAPQADPSPLAFDDPLPVAPDPPSPRTTPPADPGFPAASDAPVPPLGALAPGDGAVPDPPDPFSAASNGPGSLGKSETEELEALFEEGAKKRPATRAPATDGPAWRVRRRSGKVFGPFPEGEVVLMLGRGELLGNEEVSQDGQSWIGIGEVAAFGAAIRTLIEQPTVGEGSRSTPVVPFGTGPEAVRRPVGPGLGERLRALRLPFSGLLERLPSWGRYAIGGFAVGLVLVAGLGVGLTDYGIFFHRLVRGQVGPNRPGARLCVEARGRLAEDTWPAGRAALELTGKALALSSVDREARAIEAQVIYWMARRTGVAPEMLARAQADVAEVQEKSPGAADTLKARVSQAATAGGSAGEAPAALERWLSRNPHDEDAAFLLGEWALASGDLGRAEGLFQRVGQERPSARASHALGLVSAARESKGAAGHFEAALKLDPKHLASRLEIVALQLKAGDLAGTGRGLDALVAAEAQGLLGPRERARARQLHGELLARQLGDEPERRLAEAEKELQAAVQEDPSYAPARLAWVRFLLRRNAPERALEAIQPAVAGGGPEIVDLQARALAGTGRVLDAVNAVEAALARSGANPRLTFAKGLVLEAGGKRAEAEKLYAEAARDPGYWEPHLALGRSRLRGKDAEGASTEILMAVERAPGEPDAQAGLAELRLSRSDLSGAEEAWRKALTLDPSHAQSHLGLARVALARNDAAGAAAALERAVRFDPRLADAHVLLGGLRWKRGDLAGAAAEFKAASGLDPRNALARTRLGAVELELGKTEAAHDDLMAASNVEVALAENRYWLGRALLAKGDFQAATEQLARAVDIDPATAVHHLWLGVALDRASKLGEAADAYRAALEADPKLVEAAERLGLLQANLSRCSEAVTWLEKAIQLAPREQRIRMELADCRMKLGQATTAIQIYKDALKSDPKLVVLYYRIARATHESSGIAPAIPWYEKAAQQDRDNPMPHYYLGFSFKVRGQRAKAVEAFRAYLRLKPDADDKKDILQEIEDLGG